MSEKMPGSTHPRGHAHEHTHAAAGKTLLLAVLLTLGFAVLELLAGWQSGSLALLADAGHMATDGAALALSAFAAWLAARPPTHRHSYGLGRAEVLAALVNALSMLVIVFLIASEAWQRLQSPGSVNGPAVSVVAFIGMLVNMLVAWVLARGERNLNVRAALLHVMGDLLGSVAALVSGVVIWASGWVPIDPLLSLLTGGIILASSLRLLQESLHAALDGVPAGIDLEQIGKALASVSGVKEIHDLHVWPIGGERLALSAHVRVEHLPAWPRILADLSEVAARREIHHVTFQPESARIEQPVRFHRPG